MRLERIASLVLAVLMLTMPLATCDAVGDSSSKPIINLTIEGDPTMLDPPLSAEYQSGLLDFIFEGIMRLDKDEYVVPGIATEYDVSEDGTVFTYHLREDVKFQDGTDCNAEAVKWNYERQMPGNATPDMPYADFFSNFVSVEAPDACTVVITVAEPDATLPGTLCSMNAGGLCSPTAWQADPIAFQRNPVGAGPYTLSEWATEQYIKLAPYDGYYGGEFANSGIYLKVVKEQTVRYSEFLAGNADYQMGIGEIDKNTFANAGYEIYAQLTGLGLNYIAFSDYETNRFFSDIRVRQAVLHALDMNSLVKGVFGESATFLKSFINPAHEAGRRDYSYCEYDPEKATALLTEAGYPDGFSFVMITRAEPDYVNMAAAIQAELAKVGINMQLTVMQRGDWLGKMYMDPAEKDYDAISFAWGAGSLADVATLFYSENIGGGFNLTGYNNPAFDALYQEGKRTFDSQKYADIFVEAAQLCNDDAIGIWLQSKPSFWVKQPKLFDADAADGDVSVFGTKETGYWRHIGKTEG